MRDLARIVKWAIQSALISYSETSSGIKEARVVISDKHCLYLALEIIRVLEMGGYKITRVSPQP